VRTSRWGSLATGPLLLVLVRALSCALDSACIEEELSHASWALGSKREEKVLREEEKQGRQRCAYDVNEWEAEIHIGAGTHMNIWCFIFLEEKTTCRGIELWARVESVGVGGRGRAHDHERYASNSNRGRE